jgi:PH domain associated with Beige/BEACH
LLSPLRHCAGKSNHAIISALTKHLRFGAVDLFSINNNDTIKCEPVTGGLNGIRVPDDAPIHVVASDYIGFLTSDATYDNSNVGQLFTVESHLCCRVVVQVFSLLDAFMFPQASTSSQKIFPVDGLALVRFSEARLGDSQGPLVSSAIRLSYILLAFLEPGSLALLECVGRLRCLLSWSLDLLSESHGVDGQLHSSHRDGSSHFDRLILCTVLHCHRALQRCSIVWLAIEENEKDASFPTNDAQKKYLRRIGRVVVEFKDLVEAMFRERTDLFVTTLTKESFECLRQSLKDHETVRSKDTAARGFLDSPWVQGFKDEPTEDVDSFPQQAALAKGIVRWRSKGRQAPHSQGVLALEKLTNESASIIADFNNVIDGCFKDYLEEQRKWAETDAVRDLEYDGDTTAKRLTERHQNDTLEGSKINTARRNGADTRWKGIYRKTVGPWKDENHWKLSRQTDLLGRRTLMVQNTHFSDHSNARHDSSSTNTAPKAKADLNEVMRRNAEAFVSSASKEERDEESSLNLISDGDSSTDLETSTDADSVDRMDDFVQAVGEDEEWDKIDNQEIEGIDADGGSDSWAKTFIWAENEILIARFEPIMIVSLQSYVEGKLLLTSHGLYFRQIGEETNTITRKAVDAGEATIMEGKDRRWRLARLTEVHGRRYMLRPQALELFFADGHELLLNFPTGSRDRDRFYAKLRNSCRVRQVNSRPLTTN